MMNHSHNEDMVPPPYVEHAVVKALEIGAAEIFVNDREAFRESPNLDQHLIQFVPEGEVEIR